MYSFSVFLRRRFTKLLDIAWWCKVTKLKVCLLSSARRLSKGDLLLSGFLARGGVHDEATGIGRGIGNCIMSFVGLVL